MEVSGQLHTLTTSPFGEIAAGTHGIGGFVGPEAGQKAMEKRKPPLSEIEPEPSRPEPVALF
jgi:hypothetical protein